MSEKASVKLSTKSWHYKLIKFVLGSAAPTPWNMHNLCPYFWLLVFSMLALPIVAPFKAIIGSFFFLLGKTIDFLESTMIEPLANDWERNLTDLDVFQIFAFQKDLNKNYARIHEYQGERGFSVSWWEKKYGEKPVRPDGEWTPKFIEWYERNEKDYENLKVEKQTLEYEEYKRKEARKIKRQEFGGKIDSVVSRIGEELSSWKNIIKWTKRIVGLIITSIGLVGTFFAVSFLSRAILGLISIWSWPVFLGILLVLGLTAALIGIIVLLGHVLTYMSTKGRKLWITNILYYIGLGIFIPFKFIFYTVLWKLIFRNIGIVIKKGAILFWEGFLGFLGIFGEYFGASYTDYCPGIDWEEEK